MLVIHLLELAVVGFGIYGVYNFLKSLYERDAVEAEAELAKLNTDAEKVVTEIKTETEKL
jgi:hypothetical protein